MRVIAGTARSLRLKTPEGAGTRPTTDRIKETLFNMLQSRIGETVFLDLFCGSGGIGIEALSRGAGKAYFVDHEKEAIRCLKDNLEHTRMADHAVVLAQDALGALSVIREEQVDLIFLDPPYEAGLERKVLQRLSELSYVTKDTLIIAEALLNTDFSFVQELGLEITREKGYKTNKHVFIKRK